MDGHSNQRYHLQMPYIAATPEAFLGQYAGTGSCVALVQLAAHAPHHTSWKQGPSVLSAKQLKRGTIIATFVGGRYPDKAHGNHAAIYLSHNSHGIKVIDQWKGQVAHVRVIRFKGGHGSASNDGSAYSVVQ